MSITTTRMCDNCEVIMASHPAWMTLSFPMQGVDSPEFDFCCYECLQAWVNSDDEEEPETLNKVELVDVSMTATGRGTVHEVEQPPPAMSLAQAIAMGLSPDNPV